MNANEAITKIKLLLGLDQEITQEETIEAPVKTEIAMASTKLVDGTEVEVEGEFEVGKSCYVVTDEEKMEMPAGVHQTEDNLLITVDESGVITSVEEVDMEEPKEEEVQAEDVEEEEVSMEEESEETETEMEEEDVDIVMEVVTALKPFIDNLDELKEKVSAMEGKFEAFSKAPAAKPIKKVSEDYNSNKLDRVAKIAKMRK